MKRKRGSIIVGLLIFILILFFLFIFIYFFFTSRVYCFGKVSNGECSEIKPYFCEQGHFVKKPSVCGCPDFLKIQDENCISNYSSSPKSLELNYYLRGEEKTINFLVYEDLDNYTQGLLRWIDYEEDNKVSLENFKLKEFEDPYQNSALDELVFKIKNEANSEKDSVRIAVSLVQSIPYDFNPEIINFKKEKLNYVRHAYEVLYDNKGVCEEKSNLLAFILKELGYEVVIFHFVEEDHEAVGIKCPEEYSYKNTGYCFIETTSNSIISNYQDYYVGGIQLLSEPEIIKISDGKSLGRNMYEYKDALNIVKINKKIVEKGKINFFDKIILERLKKRYNLYYMYK